MTTQNNSVAMLISINRLAQHHGQLESRPLPRQPDQPVFKLAIELLHFFQTIRRSSNRNSPVGMKMIDMGKWKKAVQGCINRSRYHVVPERAQRIHIYHLVFKLHAAIDRKSTRLNSSHGYISYAVFCLKKKMDATGGGLLTASKQFRHCATSKSRSNTASNSTKHKSPHLSG